MGNLDNIKIGDVLLNKTYPWTKKVIALYESMVWCVGFEDYIEHDSISVLEKQGWSIASREPVEITCECRYCPRYREPEVKEIEKILLLPTGTLGSVDATRSKINEAIDQINQNTKDIAELKKKN